MLKSDRYFNLFPIIIALVFVSISCSEDVDPAGFLGTYEVEELWEIRSPDICNDGVSVCYETSTLKQQYLLTIEPSDLEGFNFKLTGIPFQNTVMAENVDTLANTIGFVQVDLEYASGLLKLRNDTLFVEYYLSEPTGLKFSQFTDINGFGIKQ